MTAGAPTKLTPLLKMQLAQYVHGGYLEQDDVIPTVQSFALLAGVGSSTLRQWHAQDVDPEFTALYKALHDAQFKVLTNKGLSGRFNPSLTGLFLGKHGYSQRQDHTSSDGSMTPQVTEIKRRIVKPDE